MTRGRQNDDEKMVFTLASRGRQRKREIFNTFLRRNRGEKEVSWENEKIKNINIINIFRFQFKIN